MELAAAEAEEDSATESADESREVQQDERIWRGS
jgi:hypothetical protein